MKLVADPTTELLEFLYLTPVGIVKFRPHGTIAMANPMAAQLLMPLAPDADMTDLYQTLSCVLPDLRQRVLAFRRLSGQVCDRLRLPAPDGRAFLELTVHKIDEETFVAVIQDITRTIEQEARISDDQQRFRAIFDNVRDYAIYTVDSDGRIDRWNRSLERIGGWTHADVVGAPISQFYPPEDRDRPAELLFRAANAGTSELEGWRVRKDGSRFWGNTIASALPDAEGHARGYVLVTRDLTDRKQMEDRLVALSLTDPLTGAFNRRAGETMLAQAHQDWLRDGRAFSLLMIDCDHFKQINDRWGHDIGDQVLAGLVRLCKERLRDVDTIFRWGGEEFLVLLPGTKSDGAVGVAERLRAEIAANPTGPACKAISVTVSIGVAEAGNPDGSSADILRRADQAVYRAKAAGRNRVIAD